MGSTDVICVLSTSKRVPSPRLSDPRLFANIHHFCCGPLAGWIHKHTRLESTKNARTRLLFDDAINLNPIFLDTPKDHSGIEYLQTDNQKHFFPSSEHGSTG